MRALPVGKGLLAGEVCAAELIDVLESVEPGLTKDHDLDRSPGATPIVTPITEAALRLACLKMRAVMESSKIKGHSYPHDSASRLGKAIKRVMDGSVGAKKGVFPLVELLKTHANTPAEFDTFLADSYVVTLPQERWPAVKSAYPLIIRSTHVYI